MVVFTGGLDLEPGELEELDACILNEGGHPFLLGTKFGSFNNQKDLPNSLEKVECELHFDPGAAIRFFNQQLKPILNNKKLKGWIFEVRKEDDNPKLIMDSLSPENISDAIASMEKVFAINKN